jgi:peroxiredoxin
MKRVIWLATCLLGIWPNTRVAQAGDVQGDTLRLFNDPKAAIFEMIWHGGGPGEDDIKPLGGICRRFQVVELSSVAPPQANVMVSPGTLYGRIHFHNSGQTTFLCGLKESSDAITEYDILFVDLNHDGHLKENEIYKGIPGTSWHSKTVYGAIDLPLSDRGRSRVHRVFAKYSRDLIYMVPLCYMQGRIHIGGKEVTAVLVDYNCDGRYDSGSPSDSPPGSFSAPRELGYDRIGWDANGDGEIKFTEQHMVGGYTVYDDKVYRIGASEDGKKVVVLQVDVPVGQLEMPVDNAFLWVDGQMGPLSLRITKGVTNLPAGTYWIKRLWIWEPSGSGRMRQSVKPGIYFDKPLRINSGLTTSLSRTQCEVTSADKVRFKARMEKERAERANLAYQSIVDKPLGRLDDFGTNLESETIETKRVILCFFDMNQRPSRNCITQLAKQAEHLKEKGITVIAIQASNIDENILNDWIKKNNIPFPVGLIQDDEEKTRFKWGVKSLPWLILTDRSHVIRAEGFGFDNLDNMIKEMNNVAQ